MVLGPGHRRRRLPRLPKGNAACLADLTSRRIRPPSRGRTLSATQLGAIETFIARREKDKSRRNHTAAVTDCRRGKVYAGASFTAQHTRERPRCHLTRRLLDTPCIDDVHKCYFVQAQLPDVRSTGSTHNHARFQDRRKPVRKRSCRKRPQPPCGVSVNLQYVV